MRVSLRWLQEFIDLPTTDVTELKYAFDMLGLTVESIDELDVDWSDVYVGTVLEIEAHPDADKIRVCQVDSGEGPSQIICGAWNFEVGATVAVARPGAVLPGGFEIAQRTIRGVESNGMICSEQELGLGEDHDGILVLDETLPVGSALDDHVELPDVVFDLDITPNRPDALSLLGVARDLAAYFKIEYRVPEVPLTTVSGKTPIAVEIDDPSGCRRFTAREIKGVSVGKSPLTMRHRLNKVGVRAISNVVDVTNYVMFELGHPLHAFDADKIEGNRLVVKRASQGETLVTLDGEERSLVPEDLIIYDDAGPTSMSGTMGGARSEVGESTTRILMEAASWDPPTIMYMWRRHDLRSEAATRFERGVDQELADVANQRASALVANLTGGEVLDGAVDVVSVPFQPVVIELAMSEVSRLLGDGFTTESVSDSLSRIGYTVDGEDPLQVTVPSFRSDSYRPADLIEEIARIHGFDKFEATLPTGPAGGLTVEQRRTRMIRSTLTGAGLHHAVNLPFVDPERLVGLGHEAGSLLTIKNPLREQESRLRPSLLPALLDAVRYNQSHGTASLGLFELGSVFAAEPDQSDPRLPVEFERLAWAVVGDVGLGGISESGGSADGAYSLALLRQLLSALGVDADITPAERPGMHPGRTASVTVDGNPIGYVGELSPSVAREYEISGRVAIAEVDVAPLIEPVAPVRAYPPSTYPHVDFDLSFLVPADQQAGALLATTNSAAGVLLESSEVFDVYEGAGVEDDQKAIAIRYRLRASDRTLEQTEIGEIRQRMIEAAASAGAELRGV